MHAVLEAQNGYGCSTSGCVCYLCNDWESGSSVSALPDADWYFWKNVFCQGVTELPICPNKDKDKSRSVKGWLDGFREAGMRFSSTVARRHHLPPLAGRPSSQSHPSPHRSFCLSPSFHHTFFIVIQAKESLFVCTHSFTHLKNQDIKSSKNRNVKHQGQRDNPFSGGPCPPQHKA